MLDNVPYVNANVQTLVAMSVEDGGASFAFCATSERIHNLQSPAHAAATARGSPPSRPETPFTPGLVKVTGVTIRLA
jgi:hypothetical protein